MQQRGCYCVGKGEQFLFFKHMRPLRAGPAGGKEGLLFCVFAARLKPCRDTCMAGGCGGGVGGFMRAPRCCARALRRKGGSNLRKTIVGGTQQIMFDFRTSYDMVFVNQTQVEIHGDIDLSST
jgi:hypothetical protein